VIPSADEQIRFLQNVQRLLEEGVFTATYKYALLLTLADIAVEQGDDSGKPLTIKTEEIAKRFVEYYWRQARPYQSKGSAAGQVLAQNTGQQASIITYVGRHEHPTVARLQREAESKWKKLIRDARRTINEQPLWKLQIVAGRPLPFLYEQTYSKDEIELKGNAVFCLRRFHVLVYDLVTAAWVRFVRQLPANRSVLGQIADLNEFLFGAERASLNRYRPILKAVQENRCLYCSRTLPSEADVDHFVPWSRYPVDLGHNVVLAHVGCNNKKRDLLAALPHLAQWVRRNEDNRDEMAQRFDSDGLMHDSAASVRIAAWAYGQAESAGSLVWSHDKELVPLPREWREILQAP
jgi:hypothetical protein